MRKKILIVSIFCLFISNNIFADKKDQIFNQGKNIYNQKCLMCHGSNGKGDGPVGKNLSEKLRPFKDFSEKQIIDFLNGGKKGLMPDFTTGLSIDEKQAVAKYIVEALLEKK